MLQLSLCRFVACPLSYLQLCTILQPTQAFHADLALLQFLSHDQFLLVKLELGVARNRLRKAWESTYLDETEHHFCWSQQASNPGQIDAIV